MKKRIFAIVFIGLTWAHAGFISAAQEDTNDYRKEAWRVFGQAAGLLGRVDSLIADPNKLSEDSLITVRTIDYEGRPIPYSRITFVGRDGDAAMSFNEAATDRDGCAYCDTLGGTFSIMAQIFSFEPQKNAWRYQSRKIEKIYNVDDKPEIIIKWPRFPEGTGKVTGNVKDQYGRPLEKFEFSLTHRDGQAQGWEEYYSIHTEQNFDNSEGYFEMSDLASLTYSYKIRAEDYSAYEWDFDMGSFTIPDEPNAVVRLDIEVEAKELLYGQAFYGDGLPLDKGGWTLWFEIYPPEQRRAERGRYFANRIDPNGFFRVTLSRKEREELLKCTGGNVEISDKSGMIGQVHIDKLSKTPEEAPKLFFPRKSPRTTLTGSHLPDMNDIRIEMNFKQSQSKKALVCFFDLEQHPSRNCIRELSKKATELKKENIEIIAFHASEMTQDELDTWLNENNVSFPVGIIEDNREETRFNWGVKALPWLILTDTDHIVTAEGFSINELEEKLK